MKNYFLMLGDIFAMLAITLIGFATHGELKTSFITRMSALFFPLIIAWFLLSPWLGLFQTEIISNPRQLWRPALAMLLAVPLAAVLRGLILNAPIIPIFVVVLITTSALGMLVWRGIYFLFNRNRAGLFTL
ncbi:MAG TPA: DUF3054 domain-containing protein [Anaerolineales bacterium]|jgi:hypothetical protein|nr:DUF3054 domain-containing protein [Anaerolineales bacterium]